MPEHGVPGPRPHGERFGRERRVRRASDFARIRHEGRSVAGARLTLAYVRRARPSDPASGESPAEYVGPQPAALARVGFIVGKRVGGAVVRNRVRRRLREQMRRHLTMLQPGYDLVLIARPLAAAASGADLARDLETLLRRARLLASAYEQATQRTI
jgi:ribonuclease P protein component